MKAMKLVHCEPKITTDWARDTKESFVYPKAKTRSAGNMDQRQLILFPYFSHEWYDAYINLCD